MRVVIDMQGAQSEFSGRRGVGRYIREFTKELILSSRNELEIYLALNGKLDCKGIFEYFEGLIDREHIKVWNYIPEVAPACTFDNQTVRPEELFREWFLHQFNADIIWVPNYQEGYGEANIATSIKLTEGNETIISTLHDVTPLLFEKEYLKENRVREWYTKKLKYVSNSDIILTVSEFSKNKIADLMGVNKDKITVALNGCDHKCFYTDDMYLSAESKENYFLYAGGADPHKNLHRMIAAYSRLSPGVQNKYKFMIAGKEPNILRDELEACANKCGIRSGRIEILGFVSDDDLRKYMQRCAAFIFPAYAEGFGLPPLEAMACGAPTLVADATSLREIADNREALFDPKSVEEMAEKMERVVTDLDYANRLIRAGIARAAEFTWKAGAQKIKHVMLGVEKKSREIMYSQQELCNDLRRILPVHDYLIKAEVAKSIAKSQLFLRPRRIFVDASAVVQTEYVTGIQRVVNGIIANLQSRFENNRDVEIAAIYSDHSINAFYYADFNGKRFVKNNKSAGDAIVSFRDSDIVIMPDLYPMNIINKREYLSHLSESGVKVITILHDIIPVEYPEFFDPVFAEEFTKYLETIAEFSGIIADSKATIDAYTTWCIEKDIKLPPFFILDYNHLGADVSKANPSKGMPNDSENVLNKIQSAPTILMVGTIEPRKKQDQILDAMEILWKNGEKINLVLVGRNGWQMESFVKRVEKHSEYNKQLMWLAGISDEYLEQIYAYSTGVICASLQEGFGLPIIEAAQYKKPLLLRDIPVFREVASDHASYFASDNKQELARAIKDWIDLIKAGKAPDSSKINYCSWEESVCNLVKKIDPTILDQNS